MEKLNILNEDFFKRRKEAKLVVENYDTEIYNRVSDIIRSILKTFNQDCSNEWWFAGNNDAYEDVGFDAATRYRDNIFIRLEEYIKPSNIIDKFGRKISLFDDGIPLRWLEEDWEEELISGKQKLDEQYQLAEAKRKLSKEEGKLKKQEDLKNKKAFKDSLKNKLSQEELDFLSRNTLK